MPVGVLDSCRNCGACHNAAAGVQLSKVVLEDLAMQRCCYTLLPGGAGMDGRRMVASSAI